MPPFDILAKRALSTTLLAGLLIVFSGCAQGNDDGADGGDTLAVDTSIAVGDTSGISSEESIYTILSDDDRFTTFVTAVDSADLDQTLSGPGPFTVFAPTNVAFEQSGVNLAQLLSGENEDDLRDLLLNHISNGKTTAASLGRQTLRTLAGGDLRISGSGDSLRVGPASVVETDIEAGNGVVHAVDDVISPSMDDESL